MGGRSMSRREHRSTAAWPWGFATLALPSKQAHWSARREFFSASRVRATHFGGRTGAASARQGQYSAGVFFSNRIFFRKNLSTALKIIGAAHGAPGVRAPACPTRHGNREGTSAASSRARSRTAALDGLSGAGRPSGGMGVPNIPAPHRTTDVVLKFSHWQINTLKVPL